MPGARHFVFRTMGLLIGEEVLEDAVGEVGAGSGDGRSPSAHPVVPPTFDPTVRCVKTASAKKKQWVADQYAWCHS